MIFGDAPIDFQSSLKAGQTQGLTVRPELLEGLTVRPELLEGWTVKPFMVRQAHHERINLKLARLKLVARLSVGLSPFQSRF